MKLIQWMLKDRTFFSYSKIENGNKKSVELQTSVLEGVFILLLLSVIF